MNHTDSVREILALNADVERILWKAQSHVSISDCVQQGLAARRASTMLANALIHCEKRQAAEIELLFDKNGNVNDVAECPNCGNWHFGAYDFGTVCAACDEPLTAAEKAELRRCDEAEGRADWRAEDLASPHSGMPGR